MVGLAFLLGVLSLSSSGCTDKQPGIDPYAQEIPSHFPPLPVPADNAMTEKRVALGKKLFFDPILSIDTTVSCASCHLASLAFTDGLPVAQGVEGRLGFRNSPTLANIAWSPIMQRDGGTATLEMQVLIPIGAHEEMDFNMYELIFRLREHAEYPALMKEAYGMEVDAFPISRALAAFERTLISGDAPFDREVFGGKEALTESQRRGMELFRSQRTKCSSCHSGVLFTSFEFENNGLYLNYADSGRARITMNHDDVGKFKVLTLRNIELTAPYMHDGSLATLEEVIEHYDRGGAGHFNQSPKVRPIGLSGQEKSDLIDFLESLTDRNFINNPAFIPE